MDMGAGQPDAGVVDSQHRSMLLRREGARTGSARLAVRRCLPDCRNAEYRQDRTLTDPGNRSVNPVWTWERANRTLALSTTSTGRMSLRRRAPDRIGSLFDDACPTAGTPDTGLAERLRTHGPCRPQLGDPDVVVTNVVSATPECP